MIICSKCGKENQDRYKFCLGCGTQLSAPEPVAVPAARGTMQSSPTPPAGYSPVVADLPVAPLTITEPESLPERSSNTSPGTPSSSVEPKPEPLPPGMELCKTCGSPNPVEFVFCGNCGGRLKEVGQKTVGIAGGGAMPSRSTETTQVGKLALIRPDGSEGGSHPLHAPETIIGRGTGPLFDNDSYLSPRHTRFTFSQGQMLVEDISSLNGVFVRTTREEPINDGDVFRIGQELLRFDVIREPQSLEDGTEVMGSPNPGYWGRISIIVGPGVDGSAFPLMGDEIVLGRERGDIMFSDDGYVSGTHAKVSIREDGYFLTDLGSSNGTFVRLNEPRHVPSGSFILIGQQLFRTDYRYR